MKIVVLKFGGTSVGTIEKIKSASLEELKSIKSIPEKKLQELFEFFNG